MRGILVYTDQGNIHIETGTFWEYKGTYIEIRDARSDLVASFKDWNGVKKVL
jgi:hypothetical protein